MLRTAIALTAVLWVTAAYSQATTPDPATAPAVAPKPAGAGSFCAAAGGGFILSEAQGLAGLRKCGKGDTVMIPNSAAYAVGKFCDFSKSMVAIGGSVLCVLQGGERPTKQ
jgi:hypothetical protein